MEHQNIIFRFLKWVEKYTKTDMIYLAKGGFWLGSGQFLTTGASFLLSLAFANLLSPDIYGIYRYVLSIMGILLIPTLAGMDSAVTQAIARNLDGSFMDGLKAKMKWGVLGSITALGVAAYYYFQGNDVLAICFLITAVFVPFTEAFDLYNSILNGRKLFKTYTRYNVLTQIFYVLVMVGTLLVTKNIFAIVAAYLISNTVLNFIFLCITLRTLPRNNEKDPETVSYGKHVSLSLVIGAIMSELDKMLIFHYMGAVDLAVYAFANLAPDQIKGVLKNIHSLAFPKFAAQTKEEIKTHIFGKAFYFAAATTVCVLAYVVLAPFIFQIFFPQYLGAVFYSQILAVSVIGASVSMFLYSGLEAQKATRELYHFNTWNNVINLVLLLPLIHFYGIIGAVIARFITRFIAIGLAAVLIKRFK